MRRAVPIGCLLLSACSFFEGDAPPEPADMEIRVATLRVRQRSADRAGRLARLVSGLRAIDADIVALQDVLSFPDFTDELDWLQRQLHFQTRFEPSGHSFGAARLGFAVASRFPILDSSALTVGDLGHPLTIAQRVRLDTPLGPLDLINVRLLEPSCGAGSWSDQVDQLLRFAEEGVTHLTPILMGHFGQPPDSPSIARLTGALGGPAPMLDVWRAARGYEAGPTQGLNLPRDFSSQERAERVDYIFLDRESASSDCLPASVDRFCLDELAPPRERGSHCGVSARLLFRGGS
ncbi:MAG: endonuclease/exonuclease/phosphatase family protein [Planctomycetota bacterium]